MILGSDCLVPVPKLRECQQQQIKLPVLGDFFMFMTTILLLVTVQLIVLSILHYGRKSKMIFKEPNYSYIENNQSMVQFVKEKQPELLQVYKDNFCYLPMDPLT